jgi:hypothetical protein
VCSTNWLNRAFFNTQMCQIMDGLEEQIALSTAPYKAVKANADKWESEEASLFQLHLPAVIKTRQAMDRIRAQVRCLRVLNALQRQGIGPGQEPQLPALGLPAEATTDPYDGSPIKLKQIEGQWLIYCVGQDLKDDGGHLADNVDVGLGPLPVNTR